MHRYGNATKQIIASAAVPAQRHVPRRSSGTKPAPSIRRCVIPARPPAYTGEYGWSMPDPAATHRRIQLQKLALALPATPTMPTTSPAAATFRENIAAVENGPRVACESRQSPVMSLVPLTAAPAPDIQPVPHPHNHHTGKRRCGFLRRRAMGYDFAMAQHGCAVANLLHFFQPVADIENGFAFSTFRRLSVINSLSASGVKTDVGSSRIISSGSCNRQPG